MIIKAPVDVGLFARYQIGKGYHFCIFHIQFVDDTLVLDEKSRKNIHNLKANCILFSIILGLKVNFHKKLMFGVNCKIGQIIFSYLFDLL